MNEWISFMLTTGEPNPPAPPRPAPPRPAPPRPAGLTNTSSNSFHRSLPSRYWPAQPCLSPAGEHTPVHILRQVFESVVADVQTLQALHAKHTDRNTSKLILRHVQVHQSFEISQLENEQHRQEMC